MSKSNDDKPKPVRDRLHRVLHHMFSFIAWFRCTPAAQPTPQTPPAASPTVAPPQDQSAHSATPVRARRDAMEPSSRPVLSDRCDTPVAQEEVFEMDPPAATQDASGNAPIGPIPSSSRSTDQPYHSNQGTSRRRYHLESPTAPRRPVVLIPGGHNGPEVVIGFPGPETPPPAPTLNDRGRVPGNASIISDLELEAATSSTPGEASTSNAPGEAYMSNVPGEIIDHQDHDVEDDQPDGAANGESSAKK